MKKIALLITTIVMMLNIAAAQNAALTDAILQMRAGILDKAMVAIEKAAQHDQTKDKAKTWWIRGEIYSFIVSTLLSVELAKRFYGLRK